ncbi:primary-amine oxidase [Ktedonosporobacter rubrisoli]|uniref:Amine oxidase n=1 Tax=Ktedonosporobacter rubrisoli TaxID=2509675 RepID=A0A4V0YYW7_KTERU|nr:primary-amine oxidase [Ktedonosporobacter rubrisoli]QBD77661.1 primary-amine oxidase [Ktedonosporobacter rubrisoli]
MHYPHHPLDPLSAEELRQVVQLVRTQRHLSERVRFVSINLHEPAKALVLSFEPGASWEREAELVLLDTQDGATYEALVSLSRQQVLSWQHLPGVQPSVMPDEFFACQQALKVHPGFREALRRRGITDMEQVMIEPWSAGNYGAPEEQVRRLVRVLTWVRLPDPAAPGLNDNGYAHPIAGLRVLFDLNTLEVVRLEDDGVQDIPAARANYTAEAVGQMRTDLKPLSIVQPEGPSFVVQGNQVSWQKWRFRVGFTTREGLVLHTLSYQDQGRTRPILYRASLAEMVVPYGDPGADHYRKNAFDIGEYGLGCMANSLELGCDCLGLVHYFAVAMADSQGQVSTWPNVICLHEEDHGLLWKHTDWRNRETEVRRSRRLVLSFIATVGNYDYAFYWYFYQDGSLEYEIKLTGVMATGALQPGEQPTYGARVEPAVFAPNHQHIFNLRLDMQVDGFTNSVEEINTQAEPLGPGNQEGNAFFARATRLTNEQEAQRDVNPLRGRYWKIVNPNVTNRLGEPVSYALSFGQTGLPFAHPQAHISQRAGFARHHLWVTPYHPQERYPAGDYPNQHPGGAGLPRWTQQKRSVEQTNVVLWCTLNLLHLPRLEDWPTMPVHSIGLMLKPAGFFDRNPALDVPPPSQESPESCTH